MVLCSVPLYLYVVFNQDKPLKIPKEFTLLGHKYAIKLEKDLFEKEECYGIADDDLKLIRLQDLGPVTRSYEDDGKKYNTIINITEETVVETFFHELVHIILDATGETEMSENERFVNIMGKCMLEIYLSSMYEKDSN